MSSEEIAVRVTHLGKRYHIYSHPQDRLKQSLVPRLRRLLGQPAPNYYREFWALRDVSFEIRKGETVGIIGRNGSGKSTLLQIICGTLTPTTGTVETTGRIAALLELGAGFNPEFTGRENVYLNGAVLGLTHEAIEARFDDIAAFADIGDFIDQPVKTYSSGMYVRLAFAVAISMDPDILVVDEALSVGDEAFQRKCFSRIRKIMDLGGTVLFVSHSGITVVDLCDRALLLDGGEQLLIGEPKLVVSRYQKLLYAPPDKVDTIRNEFKNLVLPSTQSEQHSSPSANPSAPSANPSTPSGHPVKLEACYDPGMKPKSTLHHESKGAVIQNPRITTLEGRQVNVLVRREDYIYTYTVRFDTPAFNVRFGMTIKSVSGFELGGSSSAAKNDGIEYVAAGESYDIEFRFRCLFNPGVYFLNAGVLGIVGEVPELLDRIIDAEMFRVQPEVGLISFGLIDCLIQPAVSFKPQDEMSVSSNTQASDRSH